MKAQTESASTLIVVSRRALSNAVPVVVKRRLRRAVGNARMIKAAMRPPVLPPGALDGIIARNEYGVYCVPRSCRHKPAAQAVLQARAHEPETIRLMRRTPGDIVHAGTFFGDFLPALSSSRRDTDIVWAFEPNRESYRCAHVTVQLNELQNVTLAHAGLSSEAGRAELVVSDRRGQVFGGGSWLVSGSPDGRGHETVPLVTVDEAVPSDRRVGVLQLDVEGHEQQALMGAVGTIRRCRPLLILESRAALAWIEENLSFYRVTGLVHSNVVLAAE
jgi:FkbM family methyltransferase